MRLWKLLLGVGLALPSVAIAEPLEENRVHVVPSDGSVLGMGFSAAGDVTLITVGPDSTREREPAALQPHPLLSSVILSRFLPITSRATHDRASDSFTVVDTFTTIGEEALIGPDGAVWIRTAKEIHRRLNGKTEVMLAISEGLLKCMTIDPRGKLWVGGYKTGLYEIDANLQLKHHTRANSDLTTNSMTAIHIDPTGRIWVALWDCRGILAIDGDDWTIYDSENSAIPRQNIWCITSHGDGSVWAGMGFVDPHCQDPNSVHMMRFDGVDWSPVAPSDDEGQHVHGSVRTLVSVGEWIVAAIDAESWKGQYVTAFDGETWDRIDSLPEMIHVSGFVVDPPRRELWLAVQSHGQPPMRTTLHRFRY